MLAPRVICAPALPANAMTTVVLSQLWLYGVRQLGLPVHGIAAARDAAHERRDAAHDLRGLAAELCARNCARPDCGADAARADAAGSHAARADAAGAHGAACARCCARLC